MLRFTLAQLLMLSTLFCFSPALVFGQTQTLSTSFKIKHTSTSRYFQSRKFIHTKDNAIVAVGKWGATEDGSDLLVLKLDARGEQVWAKKMVVNLRLDDYDLAEMSDGSLVFIGNSQHNAAPVNSDILFIKLTCRGDVLWSKSLSMVASVPHRFLIPYSIKEGRNNDAIISFYGDNAGQHYSVVCRVNSLGNLVWSKTFYGIEPQTQLPTVAFYSMDKIVVFGFKSLYQNSLSYNKSLFAMQLDYNTGATLTQTGYSYSEIITNHGVIVSHPKNHFYAEQLTNGGFAIFGMFSNFSQQNGYYYKLVLRSDLSVDRTAVFSVPKYVLGNWGKINVFPNGQSHIVAANYDLRRFYWYAADSLQNKVREQATVLPNTYVDLRYNVAQSGANRSLCMLSTMSDRTVSNGSIEVFQVEDNDARVLPCLGTDTTFTTVLPLSVSPGSMQWQNVNDNEAELTTLQLTSTAVTVTSQYACEPLALPPSQGEPNITISGRDSVCASGSMQQYVVRQQNQSASVIWTLDSASHGALTTVNDSAVSIKFTNVLTRPVTVTLYAVAGTCTVLKDSMKITLLPSSLKLSAGIPCYPPFTLRPGWWFKNYVWQDGSTDSTFAVTQPGRYAVTLTDYCGNVTKDSIIVASSNLYVGPDRTKCNSDTVQLVAPAGFSTYTWSPAYNLSSTSGRNVIANPLVDTSYVLRAENSSGCIVYDTVRVTVRQSPAIAFGPDVSLCAGDSIQLNAGAGFASYQWSTGTNDQTVTIKATGIYSVIASTAQGCQSQDTLRVLQVHALPRVQLDKTPAICEEEGRLLDAGAFASYLWQDGSTSRTYTVRTAGRYFVQVTDNNNCRASDTTTIATIYPSPQNFLPADTTICARELVELKALSRYNSYVWNTGNSTASITTSQPGTYWLRVTDNNGCSGKDSVSVVRKNCAVAFHIPTAFTPNGDGKNELFHPVVTGTMKDYQFSVYNRWGQLVFQTSEINKGWNGKVGDLLQSTANFIWTCMYQPEGEAKRFEKGTVLLIR